MISHKQQFRGYNNMEELQKEKETLIYIVTDEDTKRFFIENEKLTIYLMLKYKEVISNQKDLMRLIAKEIKENMKNAAS